MKQRMATALMLAALATATSACGASGGPAEDKTSSPPGQTLATVQQLWADVPALPDASAQLDAALPRRLQELARGFVRSANTSGDSDQVTAQGLDYIMYETSQTVDDVLAFYAPATMTAQGWTAGNIGCSAETATPGASADLCAYTKKNTGGANDYLIIVPFPSQTAQGRTQIAYIRAAGTR